MILCRPNNNLHEHNYDTSQKYQLRSTGIRVDIFHYPMLYLFNTIPFSGNKHKQIEQIIERALESRNPVQGFYQCARARNRCARKISANILKSTYLFNNLSILLTCALLQSSSYVIHHMQISKHSDFNRNIPFSVFKKR